MSDLIDNERTKLLANALDRASTAVFTIGIFSPLVSYYFDLQGVREAMGALGLIAFAFLSFISAAGLHYLARSVLGDLR